MKRHYIIFSVILLFLIWLLTGNIIKESENKSIKKIQATSGLYLFGMRRVWTESSNIDFYNEKGQLLESEYFNNGNKCDSKHVYEYNSFDSLTKVVWLTGVNLTPQKIETYSYDSLRRPFQNMVFEIRKLKLDTFLYEKTTWYYSLNRKYKSVIENFSKEYPSSEHVTTLIDIFNKKGLLVADSFLTEYKEAGVGSELYITKYSYDKSGHIRSKFGGLTNDSIYYRANEKGQIIEEKEKQGNSIKSLKKSWYDRNGNEIKTSYKDIENNDTYTSRYDKSNRILKERLSGNFLYILMAYKEYHYEYYD